MKIFSTMAKRQLSENDAAEANLSVSNKKRKVVNCQAVPLNDEDAWNAMFEKLVQYKDEHGDCLVPQRFKDDPKLGMWVNNQRTNYRQKKLSDDRTKTLESIGFVWRVRTLDSFDSMCNRLAEYKDENGNCSVPQRYKEDPKLGRWVMTQRNHESVGKLLPERIDKLNAMGFVWSVQPRSASVTNKMKVKKEETAENQPELRVWVEDTGDPYIV